jgi:hypothetical protein
MGRTLLALVLCVPCFVQQGFSQVPNGDFELWAGNADYEEPVQWITTNNVAAANGMAATCEKESSGSAGDFYASVTTRSGSGGIIVMGTMVTGSPDSNKRGYAFSDRPAALIGQWQYRIMPFDLGQLSVVLTRWEPSAGGRVTVGSGSVLMIDSISSWESFLVPISYALSGDPDTAIVMVAASSSPFAVVAGSRVWVDKVQFEGTAGIPEVGSRPEVKVYPSPTKGPITISTSAQMLEVAVQDMTGRAVWRRPASGRWATMDLTDLSPGRYLLGIILSDGQRVVRPVVKN